MVVVGAGITGLASGIRTAVRGDRGGIVLEASDRAGGKIDGVPDRPADRGLRAGRLHRPRSGRGRAVPPDRPRRRTSRARGPGCLRVGGRPAPAPPGALSCWACRGPLTRWRAPASSPTSSIDVLRSGLARDAPPLTADATVGEVLRPRVGDEVFERLVDPLLGGINAGSADEMSIEACAPMLYEAVSRGGPLGTALQQVAARGGGPADGPTRPTASEEIAARQDHPLEGADPNAAPGAPVFQSVRGGVTRIIDALVAELGDSLEAGRPRAVGEAIRCRSAMDRLDSERLSRSRRRDPGLPGLGVGPPAGVPGARRGAGAGRDRVLGRGAGHVRGGTAAPGPPARRQWLPGAPRPGPAHDRLLVGVVEVGPLRPRGPGRAAGVGRAHRRPSLAGPSTTPNWSRRWPEELAETGLIEPEDAAGGRFEVRVTPWPRSLPQYRPGHLGRVAAVDACLAEETPGLVAAGAALRGLGLPACIRSAQAAAKRAARAALC